MANIELKGGKLESEGNVKFLPKIKLLPKHPWVGYIIHLFQKEIQTKDDIITEPTNERFFYHSVPKPESICPIHLNHITITNTQKSGLKSRHFLL